MSLYLAKGQRSNDVVALQNALNAALRPDKPLVLDGILGPLTDAAARQFQKREGLKVDGIAGPHTLGALFEGVDVETRLCTCATDKRVVARPSLSPFDPPPQPAAGDLSFGTVGLFHREWLVSGWLRGGTPKPKLDLPPLPSLRPSFDLEALRRQKIPIDHLSLGPRPKHVGKRIGVRDAFGMEAELGASTSDFREFEYQFKLRVIQPKFEGFFRPSVTLKASPDGTWAATTTVTVKPFKILDVDWKRFSFEATALLTTSLTTPVILGEDPREPFPKLKTFVGAEGEVAFRPIRGLRNFHIFFGGRLGASGFLKFKDGKIESGIKAPDVELTGGVRLRFGLHPRF
jgi:Putative peptidoglycan binding domain